MNKFLNNVFSGTLELFVDIKETLVGLWRTSNIHKMFIVVFGAILFSLIFAVADRVGVEEHSAVGKLITCTYVARSTSTYTSTDSKGYVTTHTDVDPEHWNNVIRYENENYSLRTGRPRYVGYEGKTVYFVYFIGRFSNHFEILDRDLEAIEYIDAWD